MVETSSYLPKNGWVFLFWAVLLLMCGVAHAAEPADSGRHALLAKYPAIKAQLEDNQFKAPIYLESAEVEDSLSVDMWGILPQPFEAVRDALRSPQNWCDISSQHINVKACTWKKTDDQWLLTLYSGRKYYQAPADAYPLHLKFRLVSQQPQYLKVALSAGQGPLHIKDLRIGLEAAPLDRTRTLVRFSYSYSHGTLARMATNTYFATIARDKVGFSSIEGNGGKGSQVTGVRGSIERNAVRYYLAVESFLETRKYPEDERFERLIGRWYDRTACYPLQLKEMEKPEYLAAKRLEHRNQLMLQKQETGNGLAL
jgi:hypothetical protein